MKRTKLGGISAIMVGLLYITTVVIVLISPPGDNPVVDHVTYMKKLILVHYALGFLGVLGIMVVLAMTSTIEEYTKTNEWYPYTKVMALIGFAVLALNNLRQIGIDHQLSHDAVSKGGAVLETVVMSWAGLVELSPQGWLDFGFVGLWILTINIIMFRNTKRRFLPVLGMISGLLFIMTVFGNVTGLSSLVMIGMGLGGLVLVPIWFIVNGFILIKRDTTIQLNQSTAVMDY
jgi:hypothetical protein